MSYKISYDGVLKKVTFNEKNPKKYIRISLFCIVGIIFAVLIYTNKAKIENVIYPGNPQITKSAASTMISSINNGEDIKEAVMSFCQEIVDNANVKEK